MEKNTVDMRLKPIGVVRTVTPPIPQPNEFKTVRDLILDESLEPSLEGIEGFSHVVVLYWMHLIPAGEVPAKVRPMGRRDFPLVGLFVTRSPKRPNPIAITTVRLVDRRGSTLRVEGLDAMDGSPVIDIKPYIPGYDSVDGATMPGWLARAFDVSRTFQEVYKRLIDRYGPQGWWPADGPLEMIVGAILTQSAAWDNVEKALNRLKKAGALSASAIRQMPQNELAALIRPSGYYNAKAAKLKAFARWLGDEYGDDLARLWALDASELRRRLLAVHGIGEETADSIILYGAHKPVFVIDAYTRRIVDRLGLSPGGDSYSDYQSLLQHSIPTDVPLYQEYHALLVRLAKEVCRPCPLCAECCLKALCPSAAG